MSHSAEFSSPVDLFDVHRRFPERYPFLLQSVADHAQAGRYDILFAAGQVLAEGNVFERLSQAFHATPPAAPTELPFIGGWFLLMGYEAARWVEPRLAMPRSPHGLPDAVAVRCTAAMIFDRVRQTCVLVAEDQSDLGRLREDYERCMGMVQKSAPADLVSMVEEDSPQHFLQGVERILEYLRAGDVFQVNLSRAWRAQLQEGRNYLDVYAALRRANPAPFAGLARLGDIAVLSSSPERLVQTGDGWVQTRPIAGTRPRGDSTSEDQDFRRRLLESFKERAEHVMLIDLERNDLGRICEPGSVEVSELMAIESYAHVHHIVSNVRGKLRAGVAPGEVIQAVFPGGTITGCPKVRAMEIIAEIEGVGRGPYTGAMGYVSRCGRMDLNILIRSMVVEKGQLCFRTGAGIVADSQSAAELAETRAKAKGLLMALGAA